MKQLNALKKELNNIRLNESAVLTQIQDIYIKKLAKNKKLKKAISEVECSKDLTFIDDEFPYQWIRFDFNEVIDIDDENQVDALKEYLADQGIYIDLKNDALMLCLGSCIIINEDGDVLDQDSQKWIISRQDYETKDQCIKMINEYMDKQGYYPSVILADRYGGVRYIDMGGTK